MALRRYLPSMQFSVIAGSLLLSAGLVYGADAITHPSQTPVVVSVQDTSSQGVNQNWEATLDAIQAQNASTSIQAPDQTAVQGLLQGAQTSSLTTTIGRTLFVNLANEAGQGLGDDFPTQDKLIAQATSQVGSIQAPATYTIHDLTLVDDTPDTERAYGNAVITTLFNHPKASQRDTLIAIGYATDNNDATQLQKLGPIGKEYSALAKDLATIPVPKTFAPLHVQVLNDLLTTAATYPEMETLLSDPIRGLAGIKANQNSLDETGRLLTNIAQELSKDGIIFSKDEPGSAWSAFLPT